LRYCPNVNCSSIEQNGVVAEFLDERSHCVHCQTPLEDGPAPSWSESWETRWEELIRVGSYLDVHSAYATQSALRAAGIRAFVRDEHLAGIRWDCAIALDGVAVLVPESQAESAKELMAGVAASEAEALAATSESADRRCPRCDSTDLEHAVSGRVPAFFSILLLGLPLLFEREFVRCANCEAEYTP
jgi:hypothetical protein